MELLPHTQMLLDALKKEGFELPRNCGAIRLMMPVDDTFILNYDIVVDGEDLEKLGRALAAIGKKAKDISHE